MENSDVLNKLVHGKFRCSIIFMKKPIHETHLESLSLIQARIQVYESLTFYAYLIKFLGQ